MNPSEVAAAYDSIAPLWRDPFLEENGIWQHEKALRFRPGLGGRALDIGCGCSNRFMRLLVSHGYEVEGIDISERMIALAREQYPEAVFHHADICVWEPGELAGKIDFITAWDSIWHVPLNQSEKVLRKLCGTLAPGGILIWTTAGLDAPEAKIDDSMGPPMNYSVLGIPHTLQILAEEGCILRHLEYDQLPEKHVFLVAQKSAIAP